MKNYLIKMLSICFLLSACAENKKDDTLTFATSAEYPPFEYHEKGAIKGFDIDLAKLIAKELGKKAAFENMQFSTILPTLQNGLVDAAISTLTITEERKKSIDFSDPYYTESMATVFSIKQPISDKSQLPQKKVACQLGTTMEIWLKEHVPTAHIIPLDNNNLAIEALKVGHVDVVLMDAVQGAAFSKKNPELSYAVIGSSDKGYGVVFKKGNPLKDQVNKALKTLEMKGEIQKLKKRWLAEAP